MGTICRHPKYNFQEFQNCLYNTIMNFENSKCDYIICGDININLLMSNFNKNIATYVQMLKSNGSHSLINRGTRYSLHSKFSLFDHIHSNNTTHDKVCGVCLYDISDHLSIFITFVLIMILH